VVADEVDEYSGAIPGLYLDVVRTGIGFGPNIVRSAELNGVTFASGAIGFPILGRTEIADTHIALVSIKTAPLGSRWCGIDLTPGTLLLYGSDAKHTGISPAGIEYQLALLDLQSLREIADRIEMPLHPPAHGSVRELRHGRDHSRMSILMNSVGDLGADSPPTQWNADTVRYSALKLLSIDPSRPWRRAGLGKIDDRSVVELCVDYAHGLGRVPSIRELCRVAHVSERRLRMAFTETLGCSPLTYFRYRFMSQARHRLLTVDAPSVSHVAMDSGFTHLGRFAAAYRELYGERPSESVMHLAFDGGWNGQ
jgi:AraC-like DNA-binding protein